MGGAFSGGQNLDVAMSACSAVNTATLSRTDTILGQNAVYVELITLQKVTERGDFSPHFAL